MKRHRTGKSHRRRIRAVAMGMLVCLGLALAQVFADGTGNSLLERIDYLLYDLRYSVLPVQVADPEHQIVIIDIDERSLEAEGRWPWSRFKVADLVDKLSRAGVIVVGFDVVFSEPERNIADEVNRRLAGQPDHASLQGAMRALHAEFDADGALAATIAATDADIVLGWYLHGEQTVTVGTPHPPLRALNTDRDSGLPAMQGHTAPLDVLTNAAAGLGFVSSEPDADGVIRRSPFLMRYRDALYGALSLEMARAYLVLPEVPIELEQVGEREVPVRVRLTDRAIRLDHRGRVVVPYRGARGAYPYISATDVLHDRVDPDLLANALALVGTSSVGLGDLRATPLDRSYPGVEVHASILDGILNGGFPFRPDWAPGAMLLLLIVTGILSSIILPLLGPLLQALIGTSLVALVVVLNYWLWQAHGLDLPYAALLLMVLGILVINLISGFLSESLQRRSMKQMFDQYVPPQHIDQMLDREDASDSLEGESRDMTVLFADIRDFTTVSESLEAHQLKDLLNRYLTPVTEIIFEHGGTIDKYVGDMVVAFWGAPMEQPDHASKAVACSLALLARMDDLAREFEALDYPVLRMGIGLNTGQMHVGDMGSAYRRAYTVLGDAVNLAARLESLTRLYGVDLIVGEATRRAAVGFEFRQLDRIRVKGKNEDVEIYQPLGREGALSAQDQIRKQHMDVSLRHYMAGDWPAARAAFREFGAACPLDALLCGQFLRRIEELEREGRDDWDGIYRMIRK